MYFEKVCSHMDIKVYSMDCITNGYNSQFFPIFGGRLLSSKEFYSLFASQKNEWFVLLGEVTHELPTRREKCPYSEFFWSVFSHIRIRKTQITDTFHAVQSATLHVISGVAGKTYG